MEYFNDVITQLITLLKSKANALGISAENIIIGELGKSAKVKSPFILLYPTISKPPNPKENGKGKGAVNIGVVCGVAGDDMLENQSDSIALLGRILTLIQDPNYTRKYWVNFIDTISLTSTTAVQLLAITTLCEIAQPLLEVPDGQV